MGVDCVTHFFNLPEAVEVFWGYNVFILFLNYTFIYSNHSRLLVFSLVLFLEHLVKLPLMNCSYHCENLEKTQKATYFSDCHQEVVGHHSHLVHHPVDHEGVENLTTRELNV